MNAELVRFAKRFAYEWHEGFLPEDQSVTFELDADVHARVMERTRELAAACGISEEIAFSAIVNHAVINYRRFMGGYEHLADCQ